MYTYLHNTYTVKPVLTTTSEQRHLSTSTASLNPIFSKTDSNFIGINCE